jgi:hypothetical protein
VPAKERQVPPQRGEVVSVVADVGIREAMQAEDARRPWTERAQEIDDCITGKRGEQRALHQDHRTIDSGMAPCKTGSIL